MPVMTLQILTGPARVEWLWVNDFRPNEYHIWHAWPSTCWHVENLSYFVYVVVWCFLFCIYLYGDLVEHVSYAIMPIKYLNLNLNMIECTQTYISMESFGLCLTWGDAPWLFRSFDSLWFRIVIIAPTVIQVIARIARFAPNPSWHTVTC